MSQLNPLGPLDFDYERFPGVALRATDEKLPGHALGDRPDQLRELGIRIGMVGTHILILLKWLGISASQPELENELNTLGEAVSVLDAMGLADAAKLSEGAASKLSELEARDLASAAGGVFEALLDLLLLLLDERQHPTGLQWYKGLFDKGLVIPAPQALEDFLNPGKDRNQVFASWWVQGNNPLCVSRVTLHDIERALGGPLDPNGMYPRVMPGDTLQDADACGRLFWVDFVTLLADLEPGDFPVRKRLPKPRVLFAVKRTLPNNKEPFVPLAIFDDSKPNPKLVWSDVASPGTVNAWTRAMLASLCANQLHHTFISHFPRTHFVMEAVAVATLRELPPRHPLFWLLRTHIDGTLGFNETALGSFMTQAGADRLLMAGSLRTGQLLMRRSLDGWKDFDFPSDITQRQVDQLPYYPYRDDAQLWWNTIGIFVHGIVDAAYVDDAAMMNDGQLQKWGHVLVAKRTRADNGAELIAAAPANKAQLEVLLQKIIFTCTAYHAAVQIPLNGFDVSPLTAPCSLYPDDPADPPESMLADLGTSLFQLAFFFFGDIVTYRVGTYVGKRDDIPEKMKAPTDEFTMRAIPDIKKLIDEANRDLRTTAGAYRSLLPETVSRSVDI